MLIGIDGNEANIRNRVGVGRYAFELLRQFSNLHVPGSRFQIYLKDRPLDDLPKETDWWKYKIVGPKKFWTQIGLPLELLFHKPKPDVFFTPTHYAPRFSSSPRVIAIMDLSFLYFPRMFKVSDLYQLKNWTAYSVRKAEKILTISQASKNDIIKYYHVPEERVVVTYPGTNEAESMNDVKKKYGISGDYILSVGTLQPRKNFVKLIEAFSKILKQVQNDSLELIIAGKKGWLYEEILQAPKKFGVQDKVRFLDFVPDSDLPSLYKNAKCFCLVSLYEGFGIPVLEAMKYGCPVIVSNVSSLPEVVGEAGILVDPENAEKIAEGLLRILRLPNEERQEMIEKGRVQAAKFSWEKCAQETLNVLQEVGGKNV